MNKLYCLLIMFIACGICNGQNLVPNPSFEDTVSCPDNLHQVGNAKYWHAVDNTPDYFNACNPYAGWSVPGNQINFQYAATGVAYMGMCTYHTTFPNFREMIGAFLTSPLVSGSKYFVTFKVSFAYSPNYGFYTATNKLGILFSTVDYLSTPPSLNNYCQAYSDSIISDTLGWTTVRKSFIADSAYSFITISNFFSNANIDTLNFLGNPVQAYYFIDDLCVSEDSLYCELWTGLSDEVFADNIEIYPNPVKDILNIILKNKQLSEIIIYDIASRKIFNQSFTNSTSINTEQLTKGIYIYEVRNKNGVIKKGKVVKD